MSNLIRLTKLNEVFFKVDGERSSLAEMSDYFTFLIPNAHFNPKVKAKIWDGKIRLMNLRSNTIYCGLYEKIEEFAKEREYQLDMPSMFIPREMSVEVMQHWISKLKLPFEVRDYQFESFMNAIQKRRSLILSSTGSGKSLTLYLIVRYYFEDPENIDLLPPKKILIIVPTINLVTQMHSDFATYSKDDPDFSAEHQIHKIYSGQDKETIKPIIVSTWQSLQNMPAKYFENIGTLVIDECHLAQAKSLKSIAENCINAKYRIGTTGTLSGAKCHSMVIEGLTGPIYQATTTKHLMENKTLANLKINCIVLKHKEEDAKNIRKFQYSEEVDFIIQHKKRNTFICNLALTQKGNTLVLFQYLKHGLLLYNQLKEKSDKQVFYVHGGTDVEDREKVRELAEKETNATIVASVGVFSTGTNIVNLQSLIFASPSKSKIRVLQSIGRVLRMDQTGKATLFDVADDLQYKKHKNFVIKHFLERIKIYDEEEFDYSIYTVNI